MEKVAIVILNYLNYKDTIECIESIKNQTYGNLETIVVENGSTNESWKLIEDKYKGIEKIHLIKSEKNLGYAKGNNLGIKYGRTNLKTKFILVANNDTVLRDNNLVSKLIESYEPGVGIIGPRIIDPKNNEQNPMKLKFSDNLVYEQYKYLNSNKFKFINSNLVKSLKQTRMLYLLKKLKNISGLHKNYHDKTVDESNILHGACMFLTKDYFDKYPCFYPNTFLYYEEVIMAALLKKAGLKSKFNGNAWIYHKEDQSSIMSFNNSSSVKIKHELNSMSMCMKLLELSYKEICEEYFFNI